MFVGSGSSDCGYPWLVYSNARSKWVLPFLNQEGRVTHKIGRDAGATNQWWSHYWLDKVRNVTFVITTSDRPHAHAKIDSYFKHVGLFFVIWLQIWRKKKTPRISKQWQFPKQFSFKTARCDINRWNLNFHDLTNIFNIIIYLSGSFFFYTS